MDKVSGQFRKTLKMNYGLNFAVHKLFVHKNIHIQYLINSSTFDLIENKHSSNEIIHNTPSSLDLRSLNYWNSGQTHTGLSMLKLTGQ